MNAKFYAPGLNAWHVTCPDFTGKSFSGIFWELDSNYSALGREYQHQTPQKKAAKCFFLWIPRARGLGRESQCLPLQIGHKQIFPSIETNLARIFRLRVTRLLAFRLRFKEQEAPLNDLEGSKSRNQFEFSSSEAFWCPAAPKMCYIVLNCCTQAITGAKLRPFGSGAGGRRFVCSSLFVVL